MTESLDVDVRDNPEQNRYEAYVGQELAGFAVYVPAPGLVIFVHTEVAPEWQGRGIGRKLAKEALDDVRRRNLHMIPRCPFIAAFVRKNRAYADLVADERRAFYRLDR